MLRSIAGSKSDFKEPAAPLRPMHLVRKAHQHGHKLTISQNKTAFLVLAARHHRERLEGDGDHLTGTSGTPCARMSPSPHPIPHASPMFHLPFRPAALDGAALSPVRFSGRREGNRG